MDNSQQEISERDELASRFQFSFNRTPAGKAREVARNREELKRKIKAKKAAGGLAGPKKGQLPEEVELEEAASVSVTVQATAPANKKYAVTEIHPRTSPRGRTKWKDVSYHSSEEEAKAAADAHAKKNNLHRMKSSVAEEVDVVAEGDSQSPKGRMKPDGTRSHSTYGSRDHYSESDPQATGTPTTAKKMTKQSTDILNKAFKNASMKQGVAEEVELEEKTLTPAELKKREEIAKAMEKKNPTMDKSRKMAIATAVAKRVAEQNNDTE